MLHTITSFLIGILASIGGVQTPVTETPSQSLGSFTPAAGLTYRLTSSIGLSGTTITLSSFKNRSDIPLTMSALNTTIAYGTLDPQNSTRSELISFTGVTQNSDGTAQLTGVTRGLSDIYPFAASTTMARTHPGQSIFILSDGPSLFNEYVVKRNDETISGTWTFASTAPPRFDVDPGAAYYTTAPTTVLVDLAQLNRTAIAGASNASRTTQGLLQVAFRGQAASSTALGSTGAFAALTTDIATSSPSIGMSTSSIVLSRSDSRIHPLFFSTSTSDTYSFGNTNVIGTSTVTGVSVTATSTQFGVYGGLAPVGSLIAYASTTAPAGWLLANGAAVSRSAYSNLFAVLGTSYGVGDGSTTFNLPNLLGRTPVMASTTANIGQTGGQDLHTMTESELVAHTHAAGSGNFIVSTDGSGGDDTGGSTSAQSAATASTGSGTPFNVRDPYLAVQYIIKY